MRELLPAGPPAGPATATGVPADPDVATTICPAAPACPAAALTAEAAVATGELVPLLLIRGGLSIILFCYSVSITHSM